MARLLSPKWARFASQASSIAKPIPTLCTECHISRYLHDLRRGNVQVGNKLRGFASDITCVGLRRGILNRNPFPHTTNRYGNCSSFSTQANEGSVRNALGWARNRLGEKLKGATELAKQTLRVPSRVTRTLQLQAEGIWQQNKWLFIGTVSLLAVYTMWRTMFRVASSFINLSETFAEYGFLAFAIALATVAYIIISQRFKIRPSNVYRIAMIRLNSHPGVLEVMGAPIIGSELRAYVLVGGGLKFKNFRPKIRPRRMHMIFPIEGRDYRGLASLEVKKRRGKYDFKLLAVDVPAVEGPHPIFVHGDMTRYEKGGVLAELRDPFLKALELSAVTEEEDEVDDEQDFRREVLEHRHRPEELPKTLDQGGGMYFYERIWEGIRKFISWACLRLLQKKGQSTQ